MVCAGTFFTFSRSYGIKWDGLLGISLFLLLAGTSVNLAVNIFTTTMLIDSALRNND